MRNVWVPAAAGAFFLVSIMAACSAADEDGGSGGAGDWDDGYGSSTSKSSGSTSKSGSAGYSASSGGPGSGPGSTGAAQDPTAVFVPAECAELDSSQPTVLYVSADDSNSMTSPARARAFIQAGDVLAPIRTYEFLNYYKVDYPAPAYPSLGVHTDLKPSQDAGAYDLQIGVRSFQPISPRRPITLTFVLDTSGSMDGPRIARSRAAIKAMASQLRAGDVVSAVSWNTENLVLLDGHQVGGPNDPTVVAMANGLQANGGTDLHAGLVAGYQLATDNYASNRLNRIVLISDGEANTGVTDEDLIALHSEDADQEGIYMVGVATGPGGNDSLMDVVTDKGRGASIFLDSEAEATEIFTTRFDEVMEVAARSVQVELTMPWYFQMKHFYGEEMSTDPTEIEPQHLAPGDAMVFSQIVRACDPSVVVGSDTIRVRVRWVTPITYLPSELIVEQSIDELVAAPSPALAKGKAIVAYAEALKLDPDRDDVAAALAGALAAVEAANPNGTDPDLTEIASLITQHPAY